MQSGSVSEQWRTVYLSVTARQWHGHVKNLYLLKNCVTIFHTYATYFSGRSLGTCKLPMKKLNKLACEKLIEKRLYSESWLSTSAPAASLFAVPMSAVAIFKVTESFLPYNYTGSDNAPLLSERIFIFVKVGFFICLLLVFGISIFFVNALTLSTSA